MTKEADKRKNIETYVNKEFLIVMFDDFVRKVTRGVRDRRLLIRPRAISVGYMKMTLIVSSGDMEQT